MQKSVDICVCYVAKLKGVQQKLFKYYHRSIIPLILCLCFVITIEVKEYELYTFLI